MNAAMSAIGWTLVDFVWQGALVGLAAASLLALMGSAAPTRRYLVACVALLACLAWPAWTLAERLSAPETSGSLLLAGAPLGATGTSTAQIGAVLEPHIGTIVLAWAAISLALGLRMSLGLLWIGRAGALRGTADDALQARLQQLADRFGITREVRIRVVEHLASPITAGWLRPIVLVPASLVTGMPPDLLDALLAHELAHVKRMDYLVNLCQNVIETLLFYHPAVWWISKQVRNEREKIADDEAVSLLGEPRRLARALSELEKIQFSQHHLALSASGGDLMVRIKRLVKPEAQPASWKAVFLAMTLVLAAFAAQFPQSAHADAPSSARTEIARIDFSSCTKPQYPAESLRQQHTGAVTLEFDLDQSGGVSAARVRKSTGYPLLDEAARGALEKCSFKPAMRNGVPIGGTALIQYIWIIE